MDENQRKFIARQKLRLFNGMAFVGISTSIINYLTFAKVWASTFEYYGIPPVSLYIGLPLLVVAASWSIGYIWFMSGLWKEENSHVNLEMNPEFLQVCADVKEIKTLLKGD